MTQKSAGLEFYAARFGVEVDCYDLEISDDHDLADSGLWKQITDKIDEGRYGGGGGGAPCSSSSAARSADDGGPRPLRGEWAPELFGLKDLTPDKKACIRLGTLLAARKAEALDMFHTANLCLSGLRHEHSVWAYRLCSSCHLI